jgi:hypothetical protein
MSEYATPLYVVQALAEIREEGSINMLDRRGVAAMCSSERARAWISKADKSEYMEALNDMGAYISGDMTKGIKSDFPGVEIDPISGLPEHLFRNDEESEDGNSGNYSY